MFPYIMPRGRLLKIDMLAKVYKLKTELYNKEERNSNMTGQWYDGAHDSLDKVLDIINEYSQ
tara:strand:+ start:519 stop:704 length:186 start_codon:yes stop_codon:yes gene_type:complete